MTEVGVDLTTSASVNATVSAEGDVTVPSPNMSLKKTPQKRKLKPGQRWDGRLQGLSVEDYRDLKWNLDAAFGKTMRGGPSFTMRPNVSFGKVKSLPTFTSGDPVKALDAVRPSPPNYSMGKSHGSHRVYERSPGPAHYTQGSYMDSKKHPIFKKAMGAMWSREMMSGGQDEDTPAPGKYDHMQYLNSGACKRASNYSIKGREAWQPRSEAPGPGVGEYEITAMRFGKDTPISWTAQGKTLPKIPARGSRAYVGPGPGAYDNPGSGDREEPPTGSNLPSNPYYGFSRAVRGLV